MRQIEVGVLFLALVSIDARRVHDVIRDELRLAAEHDLDHDLLSATRLISMRRARDRRDITVPIGVSEMVAISL